MTRNDKRPTQPRMTDGDREKARRAKRRANVQLSHALTIAADPEKLAEERELKAAIGSGGGKQSKAGQRRKNEG